MACAMNATAIHGGLVGHVVGRRFTLLRWLGCSRGVESYLTEFGDPSQKACIKLLPARSGDAEVRMAAWLAATNLSHPNLIKVFTSGRCEVDSSPMLYVVTEYADEVLAEIVPERALAPQEAREMLGPTVDALAYLHAKGFVHGRLKPSNIMAVGERLKLSADGLILLGAIGKPSIERTIYDAPETIQGRIGSPADIWALGATLIEVLTQRPPAWYGAAAAEPAVPETVPEPFATIARECLRKDPARRCTLDQIRTRLDPGGILPPAKKNAVREISARLIKPAQLAGLVERAKLARLVERAKLAGAVTLADPRRRMALLGAAVLLVAALIVWQARSHHSQPLQASTETQSASPASPASAPSPAPSPNADAAPIHDQPAAPATAPATAPAAPAAAATLRETSAPDTSAVSSETDAPVAPAPAATSSQPLPAAAQLPGSAGVKGAVAHQVDPDVLASALRTISGTLKVEVQVSVDAAGSVTDAGFESAGPSKYFAGKAIDAARHWTFKPAEVNGQAASSAWILHFQFRQSGVSVTADETAP
jgi:TonB family protein